MVLEWVVQMALWEVVPTKIPIGNDPSEGNLMLKTVSRPIMWGPLAREHAYLKGMHGVPFYM